MASELDPKILRRIENLLRVADHTSGATEPERLSAALEAARVSVKYGVNLRPVLGDEPQREVKRLTVVKGAWVETITLQHCNCVGCNKRISSGDHAWVRIVEGHAQFRHTYSPCKVG